MPFQIIRDDLAHVKADAIVVAANERLVLDGGIGGRIAGLAGRANLQAACDALAPCPTGRAVATPAFDLPARHIIHAVGPRWHDGTRNEARLLRATYDAALSLAESLGDRSVALPLISSGSYGFPAPEAFDIALAAIRDFLDVHEIDVTLVLYDRQAVAAGAARFQRIARYIDDTYVAEREPFDMRMAGAPLSRVQPQATASEGPPKPKRTLREGLRAWLDKLDEPFSVTLLRLIDERGLADAQVYKRANMSRQLFSKIRSDADYRPTKKTVLSLAVALELSLDETEDLLERAGFALSHSSKFDVIIEYFITEGVYDSFTINEALYAFDQPLLG